MEQNIYQANQLAVFCLTPWEAKDGRSGTRWTNIGRAFVNKDGSIQLYLDCLPAQGQALQVRPNDRKEEGSGGGGGGATNENAGGGGFDRAKQKAQQFRQQGGAPGRQEPAF